MLTKRQPLPASVLAAQAAKDLAIAEYYQRTGHYASARFYYELLRQRYPNTEHAAKAAQGLTGLAKFRVRLADGSEGWQQPDGRTSVPQAAPHVVPPPALAPLNGKALPANTPAIVVLDNAKITITDPKGMRITPAKNAKGHCLRLEIPGLTVEVPRLSIEIGDTLWKYENDGGTPTVQAFQAVRQPQPSPASAECIGRVIIVGNKKTPDAAIRKAAELLPSQPLNAETLLLAERRLAAFKAVISIGSGPDPRVKDVVIRVQEK